MHVVSHQQAGCREDTGVARHEDFLDIEILGDTGGVQRTGTAERHEDKVARVQTLFCRDLLDGAHDIAFRNPYRAIGHRLD